MNYFMHYKSGPDIFQYHKAKEWKTQINIFLAMHCTALLSLGAVLT